MAPAPVQLVRSDPDFIRLERRRDTLGWSLAGLMVAVYGVFICLVAFGRTLIATPIGGSVITIGLPLGLGVILFAILLTAIYVWRANVEFDPLVKTVRERHQ